MFLTMFSQNGKSLCSTYSWLVIILLDRPIWVVTSSCMSNAPSIFVLLEQHMTLSVALLVHEADAIGGRSRVVRPLATKPITHLFSTDWSSTATDTETIDDPKIGSFSAVNFRKSSENHGIGEVVSTVVFISITTHTGIGILVPRGLQRHSG